jgi:hypothetical protein
MNAEPPETYRLQAEARVEDAEPLLRFLQAQPDGAVDLNGVEHLHAAIIQLLLVFRPPVVGEPADPFLRQWILPLLMP